MVDDAGQAVLAMDDIASRFSNRLPAALQQKSASSASTLNEIRQTIDSAEVRDDNLLASDGNYRYLMQQIIEFCGRPGESAVTIPELRLYFTLKAVLLEVLACKDGEAQREMLTNVVSWFQRQSSSLGSNGSSRAKGTSRAVALGRVTIKRFRDYSEETLRFSNLANLSAIKTRSLVESHANRTKSSTDLIEHDINSRLYDPRPTDRLAVSRSSGSLANSNARPRESVFSFAKPGADGLDRIWLEKRQEEANKEKLARYMRGLLQNWSAERARLEETIGRRQELLLCSRTMSERPADPDIVESDKEHLHSEGSSRGKPWTIDASRHDLPVFAESAVPESSDPVGEFSSMTTVAYQRWSSPSRKGAPRPGALHHNDLLNPMQLIEQLPGSTRSLFNPGTNVTVDLSLYQHQQEDQLIVGTQRATPRSVHVARRAELLQVDAIKSTMTRRGLNIGRATLERALVQPLPNLTSIERASLFPQAGDGLLANPFQVKTTSASKKGAKGKGKKSAGKKKGGKKKKK